MTILTSTLLPLRWRARPNWSSQRARATTRPTTVAIVSDAIYPYHKGGKEVRYHHIARGLVQRGIEVHIFTMKWWQGSASRDEDGIHYHALCRQYPLYKGERRSILEAVMFALACLRLLRYRFDVIEADHMPHLQLFTIQLVAWLRRRPLVVTWHEFWGAQYWRQYLGFPGLLAAAIERACLHIGDQIVADSSETAARLVAQGVPADRVTVVTIGIDLEAIEKAAPSERFDLLFVGRLISHKHVDHLLLAMSFGIAEYPLTCAIVGEGPEKASLEALAARLQLGDRVRFLGNVEDHSAIFSLMKGARVLALPSTREGFGIVVAEALACGLPVVTTNHEDNHARFLVKDGENGWLCEPTVASLASALGQALVSGSGRRSLLDPSRFGWQASADGLLDVLLRAMAPSRSAFR
jgi:glycosyltransferase involved in cell wall biosynthesis